MVDIWKNVPLPVLTQKEVTKRAEGVYTIRVTERKNIQDEIFYTVEVLNLFGGKDNFTDRNSKDFNTEIEAYRHMRKVIREAKEHYKELERRYKERE